MIGQTLTAEDWALVLTGLLYCYDHPGNNWTSEELARLMSVCEKLRTEIRHDKTVEEFVNLVCAYTGSEDREYATKLYPDYCNNPRWAAVMLMKAKAGPDQMDYVREFAAAMGFDPDRV